MKNVVLIGMPGSGKSTIGQLLSDELGVPFFDTDRVIEQSKGKSLQQITDELGVEQFKQIEQSVLLTWAMPEGSVIATGGSVVYSQPVVNKLREHGRLIFLQADLKTISERVNNWGQRGFVASPGQSLAEVFLQRQPLYQSAADWQVSVSGKSPEQVVEDVLAVLSGA